MAFLALHVNGFPYNDFYDGKNETTYTSSDESSIYYIQGGCTHYYRDAFPIQRRRVYKESFAVNVPFNTEKVLQDKYGVHWRKPIDTGDGHGLLDVKTVLYKGGVLLERARRRPKEEYHLEEVLLRGGCRGDRGGVLGGGGNMVAYKRGSVPNYYEKDDQS